MALFANGNVQRYMTDNSPQYAYVLLGVGGGMQFRFADPLFKSQLPWSIALSANVQWWNYDQPDPIVDPDREPPTKRRNFEHYFVRAFR